MGRKLSLDEQKQSTVVTLVSVGVSQRQAAGHVGCDPSTITKLATRDEAFAERLRGARMRSQADPLELVKRHAEKSWRAAAWLLEKCHPHLYGKNASQVDLRALEEQRIQTATILAEEITDPELRERIIDRLHQLDEPEAPQDDLMIDQQAASHAELHAESHDQSQSEPRDESLATPPQPERRSENPQLTSPDGSQMIDKPASAAQALVNTPEKPCAASKPASLACATQHPSSGCNPQHPVVGRPPAPVLPLLAGSVTLAPPIRPLLTSRDVRRDRARRRTPKAR